MTEADRRKMLVEKRAMRFSFAGSAVFVLAELISFIRTGAHAVLMDCIFDGMDLILLGPFLALIPFLYRPETEKHPYGYSQLEPLFVIAKYSILVAISIGTILDNIRLLEDGGHLVDAGEVFSFELFVTAGCLAVTLMLRSLSKKYSSDIIREELYAWKIDVVTSLGLAAAFLLQAFVSDTDAAWIAPYMDPLIAIALTCVLLVEPVREIIRNVRGLLLFSAPKEEVDRVRKICGEELAKYGARITFLDVVQTGRKTWIEVYFRKDRDTILVEELRSATAAVNARLAGYFDQYCVDIIPDVDAPASPVRKRLPEKAAV